MSNFSVRAEGLSKEYFIGSRARPHDTFRDTLVDLVTTPLRKAKDLLRGRATGAAGLNRRILALDDVSFEVAAGEALGIIGRNGAGKSTLLKILSRITEPTAGQAEIYGRVGALLEVGTGFHPELTGRENIYLNGAILGMRRQDLRRRFDEIVDFAAVEKFLDTPIKHYSSGMYLRLAFSVAAHLEPDILLVDEVLAVGDAAFQRKCMGKMADVAGEGRTVLFVSHNLSSIRQLCDRCILLQGGEIQAYGAPGEVIEKYMDSESLSSSAVLEPSSTTLRSGTGEGHIARVTVLDSSGHVGNLIGIGEPFKVRLEVSSPQVSAPIVLGLELKQMDGLQLLNLRSDSQSVIFDLPQGVGRHTFEIEVPGLPLYPGAYLLEPWFGFAKGKRVDHIHRGLCVYFESHGHFVSEQMIQPARGVMLIDCRWTQAANGTP